MNAAAPQRIFKPNHIKISEAMMADDLNYTLPSGTLQLRSLSDMFSP
jgi:hypothetical protein